MTGVVDLSTYREFLAASTDLELYMDARGNMGLAPDNEWPNQYGLDMGTDLEPAAWDLSGLLPDTVAHHFGVSRPGSPRRTSIMRQSTAAVPISEGSFIKQGAWTAGQRGAVNGRDRRKPPPPDVEAIASAARGFRAARYGYAWGNRGEFGRTPPTGVTFFNLANMTVPVIPVPDSFSAGTTHWDLYLTRADGDESTIVLQRSIPLSELDPGGTYTLYGPWRNRGKPPSKNTSGIEPKRLIRGRHFREKNSDHDSLPCRVRVAAVVANERGVSLAGTIGRALRIKAPMERVRVEGPAPSSDVRAAGTGGNGPPASFSRAPADDDPDPRTLRAPGKRPGAVHDYAGEEIDWDESALLDKINAHRAANGLHYVLVSSVLNRAAYKLARGRATNPRSIAAREGYAGRELAAERAEGSAGEAFSQLGEALKGRWTSVGVAREDGAWVVLLGEPIEEDEPRTELICEHVWEDGTVEVLPMGADAPYTTDVPRPMRATQGWHNVKNGRLRMSGASQYGSLLGDAANGFDRAGGVDVSYGSGGGEVAVTVGSPGSGVYARTYSSGRMVLSSYYFSKGTRNANRAACFHETGHCVNLDHVTVESVMNTPINVNGSNNNDRLTRYDESEMRRLWGGGSGGDSGGSGGDNEIHLGGGGGGGSREDGEPTEEEEYHWERRPAKFKEKTCVFVETPTIVKRNKDLQWAPVLQVEFESGETVWYRAYPKRGRKGTATFFEARGKFRRGVEVNILIPEEEPGGLAVGLVQEDPPTENTTVIEAPDPTALPDRPTQGGVETMPQGRYLANVQPVLADGTTGAHSEPAELLDENGAPTPLLADQLLKITPRTSVNQVRNAEWAARDANNNPVDWTPVNTGSATPGYFGLEEAGVLKLGVATATGSAPRLDARAIPVDSQTTLAVGCTLGARPVGSSFVGSARLGVRQYNAEGGFISELSVGDLASAGERPVYRVFGVGGLAFDEACAYVEIAARLAGTTVLLEAYFFDLFAFPFDAAIRKVGDDAENPFDTTPDTPFPVSSYVRMGAPRDTEVEVVEPRPPAEVLGFDAGLPTTWGLFQPSVSPPILEATALSPIFGARSLRIADLQTGTRRWGHYQKAFTQLTGLLFAPRALYRWAVRPTTGYAQFHEILDNAGQLRAALRLYSSGRLDFLMFYGGSWKTQTLTWVPNGALMDLEVGFVGGRAGFWRVSLGVNGAQRSVVHTRPVDFGTTRCRTFNLGVSNTNVATSRYDVRIDQVVITENGDILDREKPQPPAGYTPPPPDRPVRIAAGGVASPRAFEPDGLEAVKQTTIFLKPGDAPATAPVRVPLLEDALPVRPGLTYGLGLFGRWSVFTAEASPGIRVWLEGEEGEETEPELVLSLLPMSGKRGWHKAGGNGTDDWGSFTVPLDGRFTRVRVEAVLTDGFYVFQEPLLHRHSLPAFADHDAKRGYGRAMAAEGEFILDAMPDAYELGLAVPMFYAHLGVKEGLPAEPDEDEGLVESWFSTGHDRVTFSPYERVDQVPRRFLKTRVRLSRVGRTGPHVPARGVFLRTWQPRFGSITRADGSHFPGVAQVNADRLAYVEYPDVAAARVAGHHQSVPESDEIGRLYNIFIQVATEAAWQELEAMSLQDELIVTVPGAGGRVAGESYLVRLRSLARFEVRDFASSVRDGHRWLLATCAIDEAEVLSRGPNPDPMEPIEFFPKGLAPELVGA